jgi:aminocarboxymuconate-semialdehyde decarboxylase
VKIDVHNHAVPDALVELLRGAPEYGMSESPGPGGPARAADGSRRFNPRRLTRDPAVKLAQLAENGIDAAVISLLPPLFCYEVDATASQRLCEVANAGLRDFAAHRPDRLAWMAHVPMAYPKLAAELLTEAAGDGAAGVAVGTDVAGRRIDAAEFEPFWETASRLGLPVFIHPNYPAGACYPGLDDYHLQNVIGHLLETTVTIERLICAGVLDRHPNLRLVLAHGGAFFPLQAGRLRHAATVRPELAHAPADPWVYRGQVLIDTITHDAAALRFAVERMGPDNVLLGTDMPADMATPDPLSALAEAVDAATFTAIAERNPARLYQFSRG